MFVNPILAPRIRLPFSPQDASVCATTASRCIVAARNPRHHNAHEDYSRRRRLRVPRRDTHHDPDWVWHGSSDRPADAQNWTVTTLQTVEQSMHKVLKVLGKSRETITATTAPLLTRITALGVRVLRRVTHVLGRALSADSDPVDLAVEYGIAEPCPDDKTFVDPLSDWDPAPPSDVSYRDSYGNVVYLQLDGSASAIVAATDYRDVYDEHRDDILEYESSSPETNSSRIQSDHHNSSCNLNTTGDI